MDQLFNLVEGMTIGPTALLDVALTAGLIYGLLNLIQGTRAVRLVIGAILVYLVYVAAEALDLRLLSGILQAGAVVGLLALVVIFQPELRRGLERLGRVGSLDWVMAPTGAAATAERVARAVARAASSLAEARLGALIVIERETGLGETAESGVVLSAVLSEELLCSIFASRAALHDGAVIIRGDRVLVAGAVLPLSETSIARERFGTRHRAAIGITEQTDALAVVVSEQTGGISLVQRGQLRRDLDEEWLRVALVSALRPSTSRTRTAAGISAIGRAPFARGKRARGVRGRHDELRPSDERLAASAPAAAEQRTGAGGRPAAGTRGSPAALAVADPVLRGSAGGE